MNTRQELIERGVIKPACDMTKTALIKAEKKRKAKPVEVPTVKKEKK